MTSIACIFGPCGRRRRSLRGVSLVELLVALVISAIAFFGLALPLIAERTSWNVGRRQVEAQRDAQVGMRGIARIARHARQHSLGVVTSNNVTLTSWEETCVGGSPSPLIWVQGGPAFGGQLRYLVFCPSGTPPPEQVVLIDGGRSQVTNFEVTAVSSRSIRVRLEVTHEGQQDELLETELLLRNAT